MENYEIKSAVEDLLKKIDAKKKELRSSRFPEIAEKYIPQLKDAEKELEYLKSDEGVKRFNEDPVGVFVEIFDKLLLHEDRRVSEHSRVRHPKVYDSDIR